MHKCIVCGAALDESCNLMLCADMPASAQNMPSEKELEFEQSVDLQLCQCPFCGLVQFDCAPVPYYKDVIRSGGYSSTMAKLRRSQYSHFIDICHLEGKKIIEIGCGQGEFLQLLGEFPVGVYGIEHSRELVDKAKGKGLNVWEGFAENKDTGLEGGPYDAFLSFNFLEHQPDPNGMLQCIYNNLVEDGCGLLTVPDFDYILGKMAYYELLRDHIANYTTDSLRFLLNRNGFVVIEEAVVNDDTISMIVRKRSRIDISGIKAIYDDTTRRIKEFIGARIRCGKKVAVWGASHQGFTVISTTGIGDKIQYILDSAPFKQGRFSPASHVPIVSPDHFYSNPVDCILIIAPGYTDEIHKIIRSQYRTNVEVAAIKANEIVSIEELE